MIEGELLLHIGTHKTGTTSFQQFLSENEAALVARGVHTLTDPVFNQRRAGARFNVKTMAHQFIRPGLVTPARVRLQVPELNELEKQRHEDTLVELINGSHSNKIIGSAEAFCFLRTDQEFEHLARFLARITRRARFFVVFREDAAWRQSWIAQINRGSLFASALRSGIPEHQWVAADWYFDKAAIRRFWSGLGELVELDYAEHADIRVGLADQMGIDIDSLPLGSWQNVSPKT